MQPRTVLIIDADIHRIVQFDTLSAEMLQLRELGARSVIGKPFDPLSLGAAIAGEMGWSA
jgi:hypothetical protein